jgi:hypothetical protein
VAEMQARFAAVGCTGLRKQDKTLLREFANNISSKSHLPESFTMLLVQEDRRPVLSQVEERIETTAIHNTHSWADVVDNLVNTGDGKVQVSADYLLQR